MNCFDCAVYGHTAPAVAVCADCGAGLCGEHAHVEPRWLTRTMAINRVVSVDPPARAVRCGICQAARHAAAGTAGAGREALRAER